MVFLLPPQEREKGLLLFTRSCGNLGGSGGLGVQVPCGPTLLRLCDTELMDRFRPPRGKRERGKKKEEEEGGKRATLVT